jgi:tryptophan-rich sensory protein
MKKLLVKKNFLLITSLILCQLAGIIGIYFTYPSLTNWYVRLDKPSITPPDAVFGPVWIFLYLLMGVSLYLIWRELYSNKKKADRKSLFFALEMFAIQLLFNIWWPVIFFGLRAPFTALFEITILLVLIILTIFSFHKINKASSYLLMPYLLWTFYATFLNLAIVILN